MADTRLGSARRRRFLQVLAATGNVSAAARAVGRSRATLYGLRQKSADFAARWEHAEAEAVDVLEAEARRRAVDGVEEPLMGGGKLMRGDDGQMLVVRKYNDRLLEFLLKAHRPDKYRDRPVGGFVAQGELPTVRIVVGADAEDGEGESEEEEAQ